MNSLRFAKTCDLVLVNQIRWKITPDKMMVARQVRAHSFL